MQARQPGSDRHTCQPPRGKGGCVGERRASKGVAQGVDAKNHEADLCALRNLGSGRSALLRYTEPKLAHVVCAGVVVNLTMQLIRRGWSII